MQFPKLFSKTPSNLSVGSAPQKVKEMSSAKGDGNGHTNFLYIYFLFSYYLAFTPFRFRYDSHQSTFTLHSWYPQKILCAIVHVTVLLRYALEIKKVHYNLKPNINDPIVYFELIENCSSFTYKSIAFYCFWKKKDVFFKIIQLLEKSSFPKNNSCKIQNTIFLSSICTFYIVISILRLLFDPAIVKGNSAFSAFTNGSWYRGLILESKYSYLTSYEEPSKNAETTSVFDTFMAVLTAFNIQFRLMAGLYLDLCVLICVLSLWSPVAGYANSLNVSIESLKYIEFSTSNIDSIKEKKDFVVKIDENTVIYQFKLLKSLSTLICEAIGGFLVPAISEVAFGYAIDFEEAILTTDPMRRFTNMIFYASTSSTFIFAAEICRKIYSVKTWLCVYEDDLKISRNELMMILDNIAHDEICINAGGRITVNYSFVGTMVVVLVTFFIIRLQTELPSK